MIIKKVRFSDDIKSYYLEWVYEDRQLKLNSPDLPLKILEKIINKAYNTYIGIPTRGDIDAFGIEKRIMIGELEINQLFDHVPDEIVIFEKYPKSSKKELGKRTYQEII